MDKQSKEINNDVKDEECFEINLKRNDEIEEEKIENISNNENNDYLTDEEYFLDCARNNDIEELNHFIKQGFKIDSFDTRKNTALRILISYIRHGSC